MKKQLVWLLLFLLLSTTGCDADGDGMTGDAADQEPVELTMMTHDSFAISETVLAAFEEEAASHLADLQRAGELAERLRFHYWLARRPADG